MVAIITRAGGYLKALAGITTSAGAADAGKVPVLGTNGVLDESLVPASGGGFTLGTGDLATPLSGYLTHGIASSAPTSGRICYIWIPILKSQNFASLGVYTQTAPTSPINVRLGLYDDSGLGNGPNNLIVDAGFLSVSSTGRNSLALAANQLLSPPGIWLAIGVPSTLNGWVTWLFAPPPTPYPRGLPPILNPSGPNAGTYWQANPSVPGYPGIEDTSWGGAAFPAKATTPYILYHFSAIFGFVGAA